MSTVLSIPTQGWVALLIWLGVILTPWAYSIFIINKINKSGVERWGASQVKHVNAENEEVKQ